MLHQRLECEVFQTEKTKALQLLKRPHLIEEKRFRPDANFVNENLNINRKVNETVREHNF